MTTKKQTNKTDKKKPLSQDTKLDKSSSSSKPKQTKKGSDTESSSSSANSALGKKHTCFHCNTKFYDLNKPDKLCPKCGTDQSVKPVTKVKPKITKEFDIEDDLSELGEEDMLLDSEEEMDMEEDDTILEEDEA